MKIVVTMKQVGSVDESTRLSDGVLDESALEWDVNEWDLVAVEEAIRLREDQDGEVVVISVGDADVPDRLLTTLAMGADRAIHVEVPDERQSLDAIGVARLLATAIEPEAPDLVLCGVQSSDHASAATGTALAGLLGLPRIAVVRSLAYENGNFVLRRELEGGLLELLEVTPPALLTVQTGLNEPRYANLRGIRQAASKPRVTVSPAELGFDDATVATLAASRPIGLAAPPVQLGADMMEGDAEAIASQIATIIRAKVKA